MSRAILVIAVLAAAVAGSASAEQFYKWKDAQGVTHYTSTPPPKGVEASRLAVSGGSRSRIDQSLAAPDASASGDPAAPAGGAQVAQGQGSTADALEKRRETACETARQRYDVLANNAMVEWDRDGDGVSEPLDVKEHAAEMEKAQQSIGFYCKR
jgi:hypothetical protein